MIDEHLRAAARYAALARTEAPSPAADIPAMRVLRDDLYAALTELVERLTDLHPQRMRDRVTVRALARHPLQAMLHQLARHPRIGGDWLAADPPSIRWAGHPTDPTAAVGERQLWQGLAVETAQARYAVEPALARLSAASRWQLVRDLTVLVEAAAGLDRANADRWLGDSGAAATLRASAAALAATAREARAVIAPDTAPVVAPQRGHVVVVGDISQLPAAVAMLAELIRRDSERLGVQSLFGAMTVLAQTSAASTAALTAAAPSAVLPVADGAAALATHGMLMAEAVRQHRPRLGTLTPDSERVVAQAREIGAFTHAHLRDLPGRPDQVRAAAERLLGYGGAAAQATVALRTAISSLHDSGDLLTRSHSGLASYGGWSRTREVGGVDRVLAILGRAAEQAARCPQPPTARRIAAERIPATQSLEQTLARHRQQQRPANPMHAPRDATAVQR